MFSTSHASSSLKRWRSLLWEDGSYEQLKSYACEINQYEGRNAQVCDGSTRAKHLLLSAIFEQCNGKKYPAAKHAMQGVRRGSHGAIQPLSSFTATAVIHKMKTMYANHVDFRPKHSPQTRFARFLLQLEACIRKEWKRGVELAMAAYLPEM